MGGGIWNSKSFDSSKADSLKVEIRVKQERKSFDSSTIFTVRDLQPTLTDPLFVVNYRLQPVMISLLLVRYSLHWNNVTTHDDVTVTRMMTSPLPA